MIDPRRPKGDRYGYAPIGFSLGEATAHHFRKMPVPPLFFDLFPEGGGKPEVRRGTWIKYFVYVVYEIWPSEWNSTQLKQFPHVGAHVVDRNAKNPPDERPNRFLLEYGFRLVVRSCFAWLVG